MNMEHKATKTDEPIRWYWDGLKLWGIYEAIHYNRRYSNKPYKRRYFKGSPEHKDLESLEEFKLFHRTIKEEVAEKLFPEYFL
jgi:hypothetical protein